MYGPTICCQTICKDCHQMTKTATSRQQVNREPLLLNLIIWLGKLNFMITNMHHS